MIFRQHKAAFRKLKGISQGNLCKSVRTLGDIIGKYERNEVKPPIVVASKIANILEVSLDYLLGMISLELDKKTLKLLHDIKKLLETDKYNISYTIDGLIKAAKINAL